MKRKPGNQSVLVEDIAKEAFSFLVNDFGFTVSEVTVRFPEQQIYFIRDEVAVTPTAFAGEAIDTLVIKHQDGGANWEFVKRISMLERLVCPEERLKPAERMNHDSDTFRRVYRHDAAILRRFFPAVLGGHWRFPT